MTPAQLRGARAAIQMTQEDLASRAGVPRSAIAEFEADARKPRRSTIDRLRSALEAAGVVFIDADGISGIGLRTDSD